LKATDSGQVPKLMQWATAAWSRRRATGLAISTVRKDRDEARAGARREDVVNVRRSAGKRPYEVEHPEVWPALESWSIR
jgi:hypothetical protein